jgi:hypothetical protein
MFVLIYSLYLKAKPMQYRFNHQYQIAAINTELKLLLPKETILQIANTVMDYTARIAIVE